MSHLPSACSVAVDHETGVAPRPIRGRGRRFAAVSLAVLAAVGTASCSGGSTTAEGGGATSASATSVVTTVTSQPATGATSTVAAAASTSASNETSVVPTTGGGADTTGSAAAGAEGDVVVEEKLGPPDAMGFRSAVVKITNRGDKRADYIVELSLESRDGKTQYDVSAVTAYNVEPGQTTNGTILPFPKGKDAPADAVVRVKDVTRI